jgi:RNA polymerase sigma-70 factor, ECF subfamily
MPDIVDVSSLGIMSANEHPPYPTDKTSRLEDAVDRRIAAIVAGDRAAAQELLGEWIHRVGNLVRYLIGADSDVEDITQRVLVELLHSLHTFRGESRFTTWLDRITIRTTLAHMKRRRLVFARQQDIAIELAFASENGGRDNPEQYLARREAVRVLDELPEEQRTAVVLHYVVGLSVPEVAEQLAIPFETVRSRLRLGIHKLRERFGIIKDTP